MTLQILLFLFVALSVGVDFSNGQCVPRDVQNLILFGNGTLSWTESPQEICHILYFQVHIYRNEEEGYNLNVEGLSVDVSFLPFCQSWIFNVVAVSQDGSSVGHILIARIPIPEDAEIVLRDLEVTRINSELRLRWEVEDEMYVNCVERYRITVDDEDSGNLVDIYVPDNHLDLDFISPCVAYEFGVRAIYNHRPSNEGPLTSIEYDNPPARQDPPILGNIDIGATTVNTTWILESRSLNRCPLSRFLIDGGQYFNISVPIADSPDRQPVPINLNSLRPDSMYVLRVAIENSAGVSNPTILGVQTLELVPNME